MFARPLFVIISLLCLGFLPAGAADQADQWVAKARSYLGTDQALNAVKSLHFKGSFAGTEQAPDPADARKTVEQPIKISLDIIFQAPMQQRQILHSQKIERVTALDGYDAWEQISETDNKGSARLTLMSGAGVKRLRATTIENLSFYSNRGGNSRRIEVVGDETVDGTECVKVAFTHTDSIVFNRYFEKATGRLVKTVIGGGGEIREEGEIVVSGVRFPRKVINKEQSGRVTTITFDTVTVNETFPAETFAVPSFQAK